jgi:hypothetical protein
MKLAVLPLILLLLNTCGNSKSQKEIELNRQFDLRFNEAAVIKSEHLAIRFSSVVQDSRCPKSVTCIAAGNATIELELGTSKEKASLVKLGTDQDSKETSYQKYKLKLIEINPYPASPGRIESNQYIATLLITSY